MESQGHGESVAAALELSHAVEVLRRKGIIRSRRFKDDLGEWYACELYGGERVAGETEGCRDICLSRGGQRLRVKTHSFDPESRWNYLNSFPTDFDRLIVLLLSNSFTIHAIYDVPVEDLGTVIKMGDERRPSYCWDDLEQWRVNPTSLPGYKKLSSLFEPEAAPAEGAQ